MGPGPLQWCPITKQGVIGTDWNTGNSIKRDKNFFALRVTEHWNELLIPSCEVSFPEDIQNLPGHVPI